MKIPLFTELEKAQNILIAGAGGGFDVFSGLPLYFWLRNAGKTVHLANLTFSELGFCEGERPVPSLMRVLPNTGGSANYFPEVYLAQWLTNRFGETPVYAIERSGARQVHAAYESLVSTLRPDTLVLIDGGTDSLMRGDEAGLGTPQEDKALGNGSLVTAPDTVPFCIWMAAHHPLNFVEAIGKTISADGDCDTNAAIVGGIVALSAGRESIPTEWLKAREPIQV